MTAANVTGKIQYTTLAQATAEELTRHVDLLDESTEFEPDVFAVLCDEAGFEETGMILKNTGELVRSTRRGCFILNMTEAAFDAAKGLVTAGAANCISPVLRDRANQAAILIPTQEVTVRFTGIPDRSVLQELESAYVATPRVNESDAAKYVLLLGSEHSGLRAMEAAQILAMRPDVIYAEPNYLVNVVR